MFRRLIITITSLLVTFLALTVRLILQATLLESQLSPLVPHNTTQVAVHFLQRFRAVVSAKRGELQPIEHTLHVMLQHGQLDELVVDEHDLEARCTVQQHVVVLLLGIFAGPQRVNFNIIGDGATAANRTANELARSLLHLLRTMILLQAIQFVKKLLVCHHGGVDGHEEARAGARLALHVDVATHLFDNALADA